MIITELDPVSSASFGVTCKVAYEVHFNVHGVVSLEDSPPGMSSLYIPGGFTLANLLNTWVPKNLVFNHTEHEPGPG